MSKKSREVSVSKQLADAALKPEKLSAASAERSGCRACGLYKSCETPFMQITQPEGWDEGKKLVLVGEAPGEHEDRASGKPFTGPAGRILRGLLRRTGYGREDVVFLNTVRCRPRNNATPTMRQVRACRPFVLRALEVLRPRSVLALGAT